MKKNFDRNEKLYELWKKGHTIDEASMITGTPRSTVGYYFRKFRKHEKRGNTAGFIGYRRKTYSKKEQNEILDSALAKKMLWDAILQVLKRASESNNWMNAYYSLKTYELIMKLQNYYTHTDEELQIWNDAFKLYNDSIKSKSTGSETTSKGKSLEEILGPAKKKNLKLFDGLEINPD